MCSSSRVWRVVAPGGDMVVAGGHWGAMVSVQERRGEEGCTAAVSSVERGHCGHATGDHWHWRLYTDSPGSQAGC